MSKTIVMIHGMWGGGWYWENYKQFFEERGYRCHTPTLRHHDMDPADDPPPGLGTTSLTDYARDLEAYIRNLDEKPVLMGHSMGGLLAQILGAKGLARGLVLLTPAPPAGIWALKFSTLKNFLKVLMTWGFWRKPHGVSFKTAAYSTLHLLSRKDQKAVYKRMAYESGRAASEIGFWLFDRKGAAKVDESKISCPVLVVSGTQDRMTPASMARKVADKYKATYKEFQNHGHWVVGEPGWEEIAGFVAEWLDRVPE